MLGEIMRSQIIAGYLLCMSRYRCAKPNQRVAFNWQFRHKKTGAGISGGASRLRMATHAMTAYMAADAANAYPIQKTAW